jgi:hypothetical protein
MKYYDRKHKYGGKIKKVVVGWMDGCMGGNKSGSMVCLQQSKRFKYSMFALFGHFQKINKCLQNY